MNAHEHDPQAVPDRTGSAAPAVSPRGGSGDWPDALGLTWVVCFLVAFLLYAGITRYGLPWGGMQYRWTIFEGGFVVAVLARLWWVGRIGDVRHYLVGRMIPTARGMVVAAGLLVLTTVAFFATHWLNPSRAVTPTLDSLFGGLVMAPVQEELVFRGVLLTIFLAQVKGPRWWSVLLSALLFAGCHLIDNWRRGVGLTVLGLIAGAALLGTRSVAVSIIVHAFWNAMAYCPFMFQASEASPWAEPTTAP